MSDDTDARLTTLLAVVLTLIQSLEKTGAVQRSDWVGDLRALLREYERKSAPEAARKQIREILDLYDPPPAFRDSESVLRVIPGGKAPENKDA